MCWWRTGCEHKPDGRLVTATVVTSLPLCSAHGVRCTLSGVTMLSLFGALLNRPPVADKAVLARITYDPGSQRLQIPWPSGMTPGAASAPHGTGQIPYSDVLVFTYTAAEARALADVLTPDYPSTSWVYYTTNYSAYAGQLTRRSPAASSKRLGSWVQVTIGSKRVTLFKSELHPATDGPTLPLAQLVQQLIAEVNPQLVLTTGTAGAAGAGTQLGDINVAANVRSDFRRLSPSKAQWACSGLTSGMSSYLAMMPSMSPAQSRLPPSNNYQPKVWYGDTVSTDFFAYDTSDDHFGLRAYDPDIRAVEMDDAAVALGVQRAANRYLGFMSVRNASDPVMPDYSKSSSKTASSIYQKYGYWTTTNSALGTWALVAGLS